MLTSLTDIVANGIYYIVCIYVVFIVTLCV